MPAAHYSFEKDQQVSQSLLIHVDMSTIPKFEVLIHFRLGCVISLEIQVGANTTKIAVNKFCYLIGIISLCLSIALNITCS